MVLGVITSLIKESLLSAWISYKESRGLFNRALGGSGEEEGSSGHRMYSFSRAAV